MSTSKKADKSNPNYLGSAFWTFFTIAIFELLWPNVIPFEMFEFWKFEGSLGEVLKFATPVFIWGGVVTLVYSLFTQNQPDFNRLRHSVVVGGFFRSLRAGILEELAFRWLLFFGAIIGTQILDYLLLGFVNIHLVRWTYEAVLLPVTNLLSLGVFQEYLFHPLGWMIGAAMFISNIRFRNGHAYLGVFGWINSWYMGLFLFMVMFEYGLWAAVLVHFLYHFIIYFVVYVDVLFENRRTTVAQSKTIR